MQNCFDNQYVSVISLYMIEMLLNRIFFLSSVCNIYEHFNILDTISVLMGSASLTA